MLTKARMRGILAGAAVLTLFGGAWCIVALAFWRARPAWGISVASATTLVLFVACLLRLVASAKMPDSHDPASVAKAKRAGMLFGIIVGIEGGLIALTSALLAYAGLGDSTPVAVGLIVGAHFVPLAYIFEVPLYYCTGGLTVFGILGCLFIHAVGPRLLLVGLVMAGVLWLTALLLLIQTRSAAGGGRWLGAVER